MKISQNVAITANRVGSDDPEHFFSFGFRVATATLSSEFGDDRFEKKIGEKPQHVSSRGIYLELEYDRDSGPRGGIGVGGSFPEGGWGAAEGAVRLGELLGRCAILSRSEDPDRNYSVGDLYFNEAYEPKAPGASRYPANYGLQVYLPEPIFNDIQANLRMGRLPHIDIRVRGMKLLNVEEYHWDTKANETLPIVSFNTRFVAMVDYQVRKEHPPFKIPVEELYFPPNKADLSLLLQSLHNQSAWMKQLVDYQRWILYGLAPIVGYCVWRLIFH